jgi:hypothetical protein
MRLALGPKARLAALATALAGIGGLALADAREAKPAGEEKPRVEVSGYLQVDYRRGDADASESPVHEVNARRARIGIGGRLDDRVSYALSVQGDGLNAGSASVLDAGITVRLSSWARISAGQFKYDFDLQGRESASGLSLSDRPHVTQVVAGGLNGASTPSSPSGSFRDRGLNLGLGAPSGRLRGSVGLYQGSGRGSDDNSSFAPVFQLQGAPAKGLLLSGGFLYSDTVDAGDPGPGSYRAWTAGAAYERGRLLLRGEYYGARREGESGTQDVEGFYVHAVVRLGKNFEALARYQQLRDPAVLAEGSLRSADLGARCWLVRGPGRVGANLLVNALLRSSADGPLGGVTLLNDGRGAVLMRGEQVEPVVVARLQVQF